MRILHIAVAAGALLCAGCATIFNGTRQSIDFTSTPAGATVLADGQPLCQKTPCTADLKRGDEHVVQLQLPGYYPYRLILRQHGSNWAAANIFLTGGTGLIVDLITGATWYLAPEAVTVSLDPMQGRAGGGVGFFAARRLPLALTERAGP